MLRASIIDWIATAVLALVLILLAPTFVAGTSTTSADTRLECELVGAIYDHEIELGLPPDTEPEPIYIIGETEIRAISGDDLEYVMQSLPSFKSETFELLIKNNEVSVPVDCAGLHPSGHDVIIPKDKFEKDRTYWSISRAGVSRDGNQSLMFGSVSFTPSQGNGYFSAASYYLFEKKNDKWKLVGEARLWIT